MKHLTFFICVCVLFGCEVTEDGPKSSQLNYFSAHNSYLLKSAPLGTSVEDTIFGRTTVGQRTVFGSNPEGTAALNTFYITGTGAIKTRIYRQDELQSFKISWEDTTSGLDSVDVECKYYSGVPSNHQPETTLLDSVSFALTDSITVTNKNLKDWPYLTRGSSNNPLDVFFFLHCAGGTDNKTLFAVEGQIKYSGHNTLRR